MRAEHRTLATRWLARLNELLPVGTNEVFPTDSLLDHIPALISEIASYLGDSEADEFAANTFVLDKARELGELRYEQRASVHQLLREYRVWRRSSSVFVEQETRLFDFVSPAEVIAVLSRVSQAVSVLQQTTVETFIAKYTARIDEQTRRLENFNRMVSHELRQPIGALQFAFRLSENSEDEAARSGYREVIERNLTRLVRMTDQLAMMSRLKPAGDTAQTQVLPLGIVAREVARQLHDMADRREVTIRVADGLPVVDVDVAAMELILVNLVSNAIKVLRPRQDGAARGGPGLRRSRRSSPSRSGTTASASIPGTCRTSSSGPTVRTPIAIASSGPTASGWGWRSSTIASPIRGAPSSSSRASRRERRSASRCRE